MESILEIRKALDARSSTASLEELQTRGKTRVKVIRPEQIAAMVNDAVARTIAQSGLVSEDDAKKLVENSQAELKRAMSERETQAQRIARLEQQVEQESRRSAELEQELAHARAALKTTSQSGNTDAVTRLMLEMAEMKLQMARGGAAPAASSGNQLESAIERLAGSLETRLEQFGKKLGVSSAVDAEDVDYAALFKEHGEEKKVESNLDSMEATQSKGAGIGNALERLKKLRGS